MHKFYVLCPAHLLIMFSLASEFLQLQPSKKNIYPCKLKVDFMSGTSLCGGV